MLRRRIFAIPYGCNVGLQCGKRRVIALLEVPDETWCAPLRNIKNVIQNQDLAVDMWPGANSNDGNIKFFRCRLTNFIGHALKQHDICTGVL